MPIITETSRALDWECGLTIHARPPASDPQATNHGSSPAEPNTRVGGIDQPETYDRRWLHGPAQGARSFPAHPLPSPADRPWCVLASLPSSDLSVSGARRAHPSLPQGERRRAAGMIAAGGPSISRGGGARHRCVCTRIAWHCSRASSRVVSCCRAGNAPCSRNSPSEPGNLFLLWNSTARVPR